MTDYDSVKMSELVAVQEDGKDLVLVFQGDRRVRITVSGNRLVSDISG